MSPRKQAQDTAAEIGRAMLRRLRRPTIPTTLSPQAPNPTTPHLKQPKLAQFAGLLLLCADLLAIAASALLANVTHQVFILGTELGGKTEPWAISGADTRLMIFAVLQISAVFWFYLSGHYTKRRPLWDEVAQTTKTLSVLAAADALALYLLQLPFSRFWFLATWSLSIVLVPLARSLVKDLLIKARLWQKPTLVFGTGDNAIATVKALRDEQIMGMVPAALVSHGTSDRPIGAFSPEVSLPVIGMRTLEALSAEDAHRVPVFVALDDYQAFADTNLVRKIRYLFRDILIVPPISGFPLYGAEVHHVFRQDLFFLTIHNNLGRRSTRFIKRGFDIVLSATLLLLLSPMFLYLIARIRRDGGPAFFAHRRVGAHGRPFACYKFRTMVPNAAEVLQDLLRKNTDSREEWTRTFKLKHDPRITEIGHFLRRTSLDELPQLWNVLIGDMSLVGPRPVVAAELERFGDDAYYYLEARPGITGVWQVSGRSDVDYASRVYLDSWYVKNWSLWYDIVILIKTINVVTARAGAY